MIKSFFWWLRRKIWGFTPVESAVLDSVAAALPADEGGIFRAQIEAALIERVWGHKIVAFSFPALNAAPPIVRLARKGRTTIATVKVEGRISHFKTIASVVLTDGRLVELNFDPIPWSGVEGHNCDCQLLPLTGENTPMKVEAFD